MPETTLNMEARLTVDPETLRRWANDMERIWSKAKIGDSCCVASACSKSGFRIAIYIDQQWFNDREAAMLEDYEEAIICKACGQAVRDDDPTFNLCYGG